MASPKRRKREEPNAARGGTVTFVDFIKRRLSGGVDTSDLDGLSVSELRARLNESQGMN